MKTIILYLVPAIYLVTIIWLGRRSWTSQAGRALAYIAITGAAIMIGGLLAADGVSRRSVLLTTILIVLTGVLQLLLGRQLGNLLMSISMKNLASRNPAPVDMFRLPEPHESNFPSRSEPFAVARGNGATVSVYQDRVVIHWTGPLSLDRWRRRIELPIASICSVYFKVPAPNGAGYIRFIVRGDEDAEVSPSGVIRDENAVHFLRSRQADFEKVRDAILGVGRDTTA